MLIIRREQMAALAGAQADKLMTSLRSYVRRNFSEECASLTDRELLERLAAIVGHANTYGITGKRGLYKYAAIAMVYGDEFDSNPEHEWMVDYLTDEDVPDADERMGRLYAEIIDRMEEEE
jgi:hypothetical protein